MTRRETLIAYLLSSVEAEDWHAVRDAAVDIEVLDARGTRFAEKPIGDEPIQYSRWLISPQEYCSPHNSHGVQCGCDRCHWYRTGEHRRPAP